MCDLFQLQAERALSTTRGSSLERNEPPGRGRLLRGESGPKTEQSWARVLAPTFPCCVTFKKVMSLSLFKSWKKQLPRKAAEIKPGEVGSRVWKLDAASFLLRPGTGVGRKRCRVDFGKSAFKRPKSSLFLTLTLGPSCGKARLFGEGPATPLKGHCGSEKRPGTDLARGRARRAGRAPGDSARPARIF